MNWNVKEKLKKVVYYRLQNKSVMNKLVHRRKHICLVMAVCLIFVCLSYSSPSNDYFFQTDVCSNISSDDQDYFLGVNHENVNGYLVNDSSSTTFNDERKDYEDEKSKAEAYKNTAEQLIEDIQEVNERINEQAKLIEQENAEIASIDKEVEASEEDIQDVEDDIAEKREQLSNIISLIYENSIYEDELTDLMKAEDMYYLMNKDEYTSSITAYIDKKIAELEQIEEDKYDKNQELELLKESRQFQLEKYEEEQSKMAEEIAELTELMEDAKKKAEDAEAFAEQLKEKVDELEAKERELLSSRRYTGESSNVVYDGDGTDYYYTSPYPYTDEELTMLAGIIEAEAGSVSYPGMVAVGSVVMNRVESPNFDNTIEGVIYAPYQFEPVSIGTYAVILARGPASSCYQAAQDVLEGKRNVPNFYFKAAWYAEANGIEGVNIGGNVFH